MTPVNLPGALGITVFGVFLLIAARRARMQSMQVGSLLVILYGCYLILANIWLGRSIFLAPSPAPHPTIPQPPTATQSPCIRWDQVTNTMDGQDVCVYGIVQDYTENRATQLTNFYFGPRDEFFLVSTFRWTDPLEGECIVADGKVQLNTYKTPYIRIDEVASCEAWMK